MTRTDTASPGKQPPLINSIVAVIVFLSTACCLADVSVPTWDSVRSGRLTPVLPLTPLSPLTSLRMSLWIGLRVSTACSRVSSVGVSTGSGSEPSSLTSDGAADVLSSIIDFFLRVRFDIGSRKIVRGRGACSDPISTFSTSITFLSQDEVGAIDVGLVSVAVTMYETVPRSNCDAGQSFPSRKPTSEGHTSMLLGRPFSGNTRLNPNSYLPGSSLPSPLSTCSS